MSIAPFHEKPGSSISAYCEAKLNELVRLPLLRDVQSEASRKVKQSFLGTKEELLIAESVAMQKATQRHEEAENAYRAAEDEIHKEFRLLLQEKYNTRDNPKEYLLYKIAHDWGRPYGFHKIEYYYAELSQLIQ